MFKMWGLPLPVTRAWHVGAPPPWLVVDQPLITWVTMALAYLVVGPHSMSTRLGLHAPLSQLLYGSQPMAPSHCSSCAPPNLPPY